MTSAKTPARWGKDYIRSDLLPSQVCKPPMDGRVKGGASRQRQANWGRDGRSGNELPCACEFYTHPSIGAPRGGYGLTLSGQLRGWVGGDAGAFQVGSSAAGGIPDSTSRPW